VAADRMQRKWQLAVSRIAVGVIGVLFARLEQPARLIVIGSPQVVSVNCMADAVPVHRRAMGVVVISVSLSGPRSMPPAVEEVASRPAVSPRRRDVAAVAIVVQSCSRWRKAVRECRCASRDAAQAEGQTTRPAK